MRLRPDQATRISFLRICICRCIAVLVLGLCLQVIAGCGGGGGGQKAPAASSISLAVSQTSVQAGTAVTATATVLPATATGSVTFSDNGSALGTSTLSSGQASLVLPSLATGTHSLTASYSGGGAYTASSSAAVSVVVQPAAPVPTTATLSSSATSITAGAAVTLTTTITPAAASGTVTFLDGTASFGTATLSAGRASFSTSSLAAGTHTISSTYSGDSTYAGSTAPAIAILVKASTPPSLSPPSTTIAPGNQQVFSLLNSPTGAQSYRWTVSGSVGTVADVGGSAQTTYCTANASTTYTANSSNTTAASDTLSANVYATKDCSGSALATLSATINISAPVGNTLLPGGTSQNFTATVVLPPGVTIPLTSLTVLDSLGQTAPNSAGGFTIPRYAGGPQIVFVLAPDRTPMLMGWMDANHTTVSASTTAEVLSFYALGGELLLTETDRENVIAGMTQVPGFTNLASVVAQQLSSNPDTFATPNASIQQAVNQMFTANTGITPKVQTARIKPMDVTITPGEATTQSGVSVSSTEPAPPYFTNSTVGPYSTFVKNAYRRRTHAFIIKQKDTLNGQDTAVGSQIADFEVPPTTGVNGGVTGAAVDIIKAYFGNQPTAYAPVTSDPVNLPVDSGFDATTYQVINVGPGGSGRPNAITLTSAQQAQLVATSINGICADFIVPIINNIIINGAADSDNAANSPVSGSVRSAFVLNLEKNVANLLSGISADQDKIVAGDYKGTFQDLFLNAGTYPALASAIQDSLKAAVTASGAPAPTLDFVNRSLNSFNTVMNSAGAILQGFDTLVYVSQIANSDNVDLWTINSTRFVAKLAPASATLSGVGSVPLQGSVLATTTTSNLSYKFTLAPASGQSLVGTLSGTGGSVPDANGNLSFCTSVPNVLYANDAAAVAALKLQATDTVSMTVYSGGNCQAANLLSNTANATITTQPYGFIAVSPSASTINPGDSVTLTAKYSDPSANPPTVPGSYNWVLSAGTSPGPNGTIQGQGSGSDAGSRGGICTTNNTITYQSTAKFPLGADVMDNVQVRAYSNSTCSSSGNLPSAGSAVAVATITASGAPRLRVNPSSTLNPGSQISLTAAFRLGFSNTPTPGSYQWTTSGSYGTLTETGGMARTGQLTYCSTSASATYVSTANPSLTTAETDTVTVTPYADTQCNTADGLAGTATMNIVPPPAPYTAPGQITSVLQSGDGNFYAAATGQCGSYSGYCDYILRFDAQGHSTVLHTFDPVRSDNTNEDGASVNNLIEGHDGLIYGSAKMGGLSGQGTLFSMTKAGLFTVLQGFPSINYPLSGYGTSYHCGNFQTGTGTAYPFGGTPGPIVEGEDGALYGIEQTTPPGLGPGVGAGGSISGGLFRQIVNGGFNVQRVFIPYVSTLVPGPGATGPGNCGYVIQSYAVDPAFITSSVTSNPPALTQGADGSFYTPMTPASGSGFAPNAIAKINGQTLSVVYSLANDGSQGIGTTNPLWLAANGGIFGTSSIGDFLLQGSSFKQLNNPGSPLTLLGSDGNFYSTSTSGGATNSSSILQVTPSGTESALAPVSNADPKSNITGATGTGSVIEAANGNLVGGAVGNDTTKPSGQQTTYFLFNVPSNGQLTGNIHLSFPSATAPINQPVRLTWTVNNAFSLTAQQCHATVQTQASGTTAGAGNWSGPQVGTMNGSVYTGYSNIVPSVAGTYTYALTCGGTQSGFATLTVQ